MSNIILIMLGLILLLCVTYFCALCIYNENQSDNASLEVHHDDYAESSIQRTPLNYDPTKGICGENIILGKSRRDIENLWGLSPNSGQYQFSKDFLG